MRPVSDFHNKVRLAQMNLAAAEELTTVLVQVRAGEARSIANDLRNVAQRAANLAAVCERCESGLARSR